MQLAVRAGASEYGAENGLDRLRSRSQIYVIGTRLIIAPQKGAPLTIVGHSTVFMQAMNGKHRKSRA